MTRRYDYVDSWETMSGGRMLGHRIAFMPSGMATAYGMTSFAGFGDYGAADTGKYFKITRDGTVFFKGGTVQGNAYLVAFDGPSRTKLIEGEPGGYINFSYPWNVSKRDVTREARKQELDAAVVDSRSNYYEAEKRAKEIIAEGEAALEQAGKAIVPQTIQAGSGSELIAAYDERDRAGAEAARLAAEAAAAGKKPPGKKKRKKRPAKKGVPGWVWLAGGGTVLALVVGAIVLKKRSGGA